MRTLPGALLVLALLGALQGARAAERVWIASGTTGGTYRDVYARALQQQLAGFTVLHRTTSGSGENLALLADRKVQLAFAQADIFAARLASDPERYAGVRNLGRMGTECLFVAVRADGPIQTPEQLQTPVDGRPPEVAVGAPNGGAQGTWDYLSSLVPELGQAVAHAVGGRVALRLMLRGTFDAVVWVTDPSNLDHLLLRTVRDSPRLRLMEISPEDTSRGGALPDGTPVYEGREIEVGADSGPLTTLCTSALLLTREGAESAVVERAARVPGLEPPGAGRPTATDPPAAP